MGKGPRGVGNKTTSNTTRRSDRMRTKEKNTIVFGKKKFLVTLTREVSIKLWGRKSAV